MGKDLLNVLIIDDSAFSRQTIRDILKKDPDVGEVNIAFDGKDGLEKILKKRPDIVTLDLEMPEMDGFTLLRWIMENNPIPVIVISAHGGNNAVFKALQLGAVDFILKPTKIANEGLKMIEEDLLRKLSAVKSMRMENIVKNLAMMDRVAKGEAKGIRRNNIEIIAIGASTGGPTAIQTILSRLTPNLSATILISQHMPEGFTRFFAERMNTISLLHVKEARDGEPIKKGEVLICPGGYHLLLKKIGDNVYVNLQRSLTSDTYVPSIDLMMKSAAEIYNDKVMGIILTGMGKDGVMGMAKIKEKKGITIVESKDSAVVYGMAYEAVSSGVVEKVLPLNDIPDEILRCVALSSQI